MGEPQEHQRAGARDELIGRLGDPAEEAKNTFESVASKDKEKVFIIGGEHGYEPNGPKKGKGDQREQLLDAITKWANKRWPQASGSSAAR